VCFFRDMYIFDRQPDRYVSRALNLISLVLARTVIENFVCISRKQLQKHQQQPNLTLETLGFGFSFGFSRISGWAGAKPQLSCPVTWNFKCHNFWQFDSRTEKTRAPTASIQFVVLLVGHKPGGPEFLAPTVTKKWPTNKQSDKLNHCGSMGKLMQ